MIYKLKAHFVEKIWGDQKFSNLKGYNPSSLLGETWEVSTHGSGLSTLENGQTLNEIVELSYLVKLISTSDNLSVQVHPGNEYSLKNEGQKGKTECWFILDSKPGAGIYLGFKPDVCQKEFKRAVDDGDDLTKYLNFIEVEKGDFFYLPSGSIHALGSDVFLAEVQQSSGVTYRVWDWNRVDSNGVPRELHIDKAMDVLNFDNEFNRNLLSSSSKDLFSDSNFNIKHDDFNCSLKLKGETISRQSGSLLNLDSDIIVNGIKISPYEALFFDDEELNIAGDSPFLIITN